MLAAAQQGISGYNLHIYNHNTMRKWMLTFMNKIVPISGGLEAGVRLAPDLGVNSAIANFTEFLDIL